MIRSKERKKTREEFGFPNTTNLETITFFLTKARRKTEPQGQLAFMRHAQVITITKQTDDDDDGGGVHFNWPSN